MHYLAVVAGLALGLRGIRFALGESWLVMPSFFVMVFLCLEWVTGRRKWLQALFGAVAAAVFAVYSYIAPVDNGREGPGLAILGTAVALPLLAAGRVPEQRSRP